MCVCVCVCVGGGGGGGGGSQGASTAWILFKYLGPSGEAKFHLLLQDECESLLDWHCTLPEVLDFTPPFVTILRVQVSGYPPGRYF